MPHFSAVPDWKLSLRSFALGTFCVWLLLAEKLCSWLLNASLGVNLSRSDTYFLYAALIEGVLLLVLRIVVRRSKFGIIWRGLLLGVVFNFGCFLVTESSSLQSFGLYLMALSTFHWSEYILQSMFNPSTTTTDSYMLWHSNAYVAAFCLSLTEFSLEYYLWPGLKSNGYVSKSGLVLVIGGESLRKIAMWTAKSNFSHHVQYAKADGHELVTKGVYSWFRHPSYVGWFWWSVGTQLLLCNPVCVLVYALASWKFFDARVHEEESTLISFFGEKYLEYQQNVGTGLPFITGYHIKQFDQKFKTVN